MEKIILTASGGPFRTLPADDFNRITVEDALNHPTWSMGSKITVDSATMFNKALEIIEAHWLFATPAEKLDVVIHPQSIVHSFVRFIDGSAIAHMALPDMALPIRYALTYPVRCETDLARIDFSEALDLTFEPVDPIRFPSVEMGYRAAAEGGTTGAVLSAANESAVKCFLAGEAPFTAIFEAVRDAMDAHRAVPADSLDAVLAADRWARARVENFLRT